MTRLWLILLVAATQLVATARAQDATGTVRLTSRAQFYERPPGTVALLPQVEVAEEAKFAGQWDLLVDGGRYELSKDRGYCFVVNHRDPDQKGESSYVAIGALSVLDPKANHARPISLFRNFGWSVSPDDKDYKRKNNKPVHVKVTPEAFVMAHEQVRLEENEKLLEHRWHGHYGNGESWADRDVWVSLASAESIRSRLGRNVEASDLRFDGKLLRFDFTEKFNSNRPVAFCMASSLRIATVLTVFGPHFSQAQRQFELVFR